MTPTDQIEKLRRTIEHAARCYYVDAQSVMSDPEYDQLLRQLQTLEQQHPELVTPNSPTQRVMQGLLPGFQTVAHAQPMLSLDNAFNAEDVARFLKRCASRDTGVWQLTVEPKVDGLSLDLLYRNGELVRALTRGDGAQGDDVTAQARTIRNLPLRLNVPRAYASMMQHDLHVRGEVYMSREVFKQLNKAKSDAGLQLMANPRNAAAGALKLLDPAETARRQLSFLGYTAFGLGTDVRPHTALLMMLRLLGFQTFTLGQECVVIGGREVNPTVEQVMAALEKLDQLRKRLPYETDGAVLKVGDPMLRDLLGFSRTSPNWAIAFKYPPEEVVTLVRHVTIQVGRHGTLTPVAELDPVQVSGSTVSRATLHNFGYIAEKDVRVGDQVVISKAGEIIPQVVRVLTERRRPEIRYEEIKPPEKCPYCGNPAGRDKEEAAAICCVNPGCREVLVRRLEHLVSKDAMDVEDLGPTLVRKLVEGGYVEFLPDIFSFGADQLRQFGFGAVLAGKIHQALQLAKSERPQDKLLYGMSIPNVGRTASRALVAHFGGIKALLTVPDAEITNCPDLKPNSAVSFLEWRQRPETERLVRQLELLGFDLAGQARIVRGEQMAGHKVVITGELSIERDAMADIIRSHGGQVVGSVSKKTTLLVVGDAPGRTKLNKASELGIKQVGEAELRGMMV